MRSASRPRARAPLIVVAVIIALAPTASPAAGGRHAAIVVDGNSGRVLMEEAADEQRYPASLTKMMTLYLAFEQFERGKLRPDTPIRISQEAAAQQPSKLDLAPGETITAIDAVRALITKSANDIAVALAEHMAGNERAFAARMTEKARELGMTRTTFRNASGLPDTGQVTTARDMVRLAMRLHDDFPKYYPLFALRSFSYRGATHANHNTMLRTFEGTEGMKTGYIGASGFNVVTAVRRGPKHVFGAVFGGATGAARNATMRTAFMKTLPHALTMRSRSIVLPTLVATARPGTGETGRQTTVIATQRAAPSQAAIAAAQPIAPITTAITAQPTAPNVPANVVSPVAVAQVRRVAIAPRPMADTAVPPMASAPPRPVLAAGPSVATQQPAPPPIKPAAAAALPPSSLQAQASALAPLVYPQPPASAAPKPTVVASLGAPARLAGPTAAVAGGYHLQIGAYQSQAEAERALAVARTRAGQSIGNAQAVTVPVQKDNRQLFRARFAGFTADGAAAVCLELRRQAVDCFVMKGE